MAVVGRHLVLPIALAASGGVPYLMSEGNMDAMWSDGNGPPPQPAGVVEQVDIPEGPLPARMASMPNIEHFGQVIRFDVHPQWITQLWPRVQTDVPSPMYFGYRVPLVTGTRTDDLAGTLTYYFDREEKCAQVTFFGTTGDRERLIYFLKSVYNMEDATPDQPGHRLLVNKRFGKVMSWCKIRPLPIVDHQSPMRTFEIALDLKRPVQ